MTILHFHQAEIIDFDERDCDYIAAIETQTTQHGLQTYIILMDAEEQVKLVIGSILAKDIDSLTESRKYAMNMLSDSEYCDSVWNHYKIID